MPDGRVWKLSFALEQMVDDRNLRKWVEAGPSGVLILAGKYLPENLKSKIARIGQ